MYYFFKCIAKINNIERIKIIYFVNRFKNITYFLLLLKNLDGLRGRGVQCGEDFFFVAVLPFIGNQLAILTIVNLAKTIDVDPKNFSYDENR